VKIVAQLPFALLLDFGFSWSFIIKFQNATDKLSDVALVYSDVYWLFTQPGKFRLNFSYHISQVSQLVSLRKLEASTWTNLWTLSDRFWNPNMNYCTASQSVNHRRQLDLSARTERSQTECQLQIFQVRLLSLHTR
jgi:hypothetical protein